MTPTEKLLSVFSLFSGEKVEWSAEEAAAHLGFSISTTYRYLKNLSDAGLIIAFVAGHYVLGPAIIQLDTNTRVNDPLIRVGSPMIRRLAEEMASPAVFLLSRLYRRQIICIHQEAAHFGDTKNYERGRLMPLHRGAASKIILAHLPGPIVRAYLEEHREDIEAVGLGHDWTRSKRILGALRHANFCVTHAELAADETIIAAPIFAPDGSVTGSLSLLVACNEDRYKLHPSIVEKIRYAAAQITIGLGQIAAGWNQLEEERLRSVNTGPGLTKVQGSGAATGMLRKTITNMGTISSSKLAGQELTVAFTSSVRAPRRNHHYQAGAQSKPRKPSSRMVE